VAYKFGFNIKQFHRINNHPFAYLKVNGNQLVLVIRNIMQHHNQKVSIMNDEQIKEIYPEIFNNLIDYALIRNEPSYLLVYTIFYKPNNGYVLVNT
jgi:hypothetical protein